MLMRARTCTLPRLLAVGAASAEHALPASSPMPHEDHDTSGVMDEDDISLCSHGSTLSAAGSAYSPIVLPYSIVQEVNGKKSTSKGPSL